MFVWMWMNWLWRTWPFLSIWSSKKNLWTKGNFDITYKTSLLQRTIVNIFMCIFSFLILSIWCWVLWCSFKNDFVLELDFEPFTDSFPRPTLSKSIGNGVQFLNRHLSSKMFHDKESMYPLLDFLRVHSYKGKVIRCLCCCIILCSSFTRIHVGYILLWKQSWVLCKAQKLNNQEIQGFTWFGDVPMFMGEIQLLLSSENNRVSKFLEIFLSILTSSPISIIKP